MRHIAGVMAFPSTKILSVALDPRSGAGVTDWKNSTDQKSDGYWVSSQALVCSLYYSSILMATKIKINSPKTLNQKGLL